MSAPGDDPRLLDEYIDGQLAGERRDRYERDVLGRSAELAAEVDRQRILDASLRRVFAVPAGTRARKEQTDVDRRKPTHRGTLPARSSSRILAIAAVLAAGVFGGWRIWQFVQPPKLQDPYALTPWRSMFAVYDAVVTGGFRPEWVCKDDAEFAKVTRKRLGTPLLLAQSDAVAALGWQYANTLGPHTLCLLAAVRAEPAAEPTNVIVFADRVRNDRPPDEPETSARHVFRRIIDSVVLYEVTPLSAPMVLERFYQPGS